VPLVLDTCHQWKKEQNNNWRGSQRATCNARWSSKFKSSTLWTTSSLSQANDNQITNYTSHLLYLSDTCEIVSDIQSSHTSMIHVIVYYRRTVNQDSAEWQVVCCCRSSKVCNTLPALLPCLWCIPLRTLGICIEGTRVWQRLRRVATFLLIYSS